MSKRRRKGKLHKLSHEYRAKRVAKQEKDKLRAARIWARRHVQGK